jgi:hypothetical protein
MIHIQNTEQRTVKVATAPSPEEMSGCALTNSCTTSAASFAGCRDINTCSCETRDRVRTVTQQGASRVVEWDRPRRFHRVVIACRPYPVWVCVIQLFRNDHIEGLVVHTGQAGLQRHVKMFLDNSTVCEGRLQGIHEFAVDGLQLLVMNTGSLHDALVQELEGAHDFRLELDRRQLFVLLTEGQLCWPRWSRR